MVTTMLMALTSGVGGAAGCTRDVHLLSARTPLDAGLFEGGTLPTPDGGIGVSCAVGGTPIALPTANGAVCAAALAARAHRFALCSCTSQAILAPFGTDVFNSSSGVVGGEASAAIGVDGDLEADAEIVVSGAVHVAGAGGLASSMSLQAARSLRVAGPTRITSGAAAVGTDAFLGGDVSGIVIVDGDLHLAPRALSSQALLSAQSIVREEVSVPPPCDCASTFVDIPAAIGAIMASNDNRAIGLEPGLLTNVTASIARDIPCGRFALSAIDAQQAVLLKVRGRAVLAVAGDVALRGGLRVELDPGAELDLLVGGNLVTSGGNSIGSVFPARFRIWIAGDGLTSLDDRPRIGAMVHAPRSLVTAPDGLELSGALLSRTLLAGPVNIHFDQAIFSSGVACAEPIAPSIE